MKKFRYNLRGQVETGFDNSIDHELFGHPRNPEYQELCQYEQKKMQERDCNSRERSDAETIDTNDYDENIPF